MKRLVSLLPQLSEQELNYMMDGDSALKETYDLIVLGTGLVQSLVAGAVALTGRKVMHIDKNDFYGEYNSSHSIESFPSMVVPKGPSVRNASDDGDENLLYFSQEKLPRLQSFFVFTTKFQKSKTNLSSKEEIPSWIYCGRCPVWPRIHIQIYYIRY